MAFAETAGTIINGAALIGSWLGIGEKRQDRRQIKQQTALNEVNAKTAKELADYEQGLKMKMWHDTNYSAQLREAEKAGISKAAAIGGASSGVGTGASVNGIAGTGAADAAATQQANTNQMLATAQIANIAADTKLKEANAEKISGADTKNTEANTEKAKIEAAFTKLQTEIGTEAKWDAIDRIRYEADKLMHESNIAGTNQVIAENTRIEVENTIKQKAIGAMLENQATRQGIKLDKARVEQIANDITTKLQQLEIERKGQEISKENMEKLTEAMLWSAGINATGNIINGILDVKKMKMGKEIDYKNREKGERETIEKFDKEGNYSGGQTRSRTKY